MALLNKELGPIEGRNEEKVLGVGGWTTEEFDKMKLMYQAFKKCTTLDTFSRANRSWVSKNYPDELPVDDLNNIDENSHLNTSTNLSSQPFKVDTAIPLHHKALTATPSPRKLPTLEAPLICTSKRTPKPNHKFLDDAWEDDFESHSRSRKKPHMTDKNDAVLTPSEALSMQTQVKKIKCCVCNCLKEMQQRMKELGNFCCADCANFYLDKAPRFIKGKLNIACKYEPSKCLLSYRE